MAKKEALFEKVGETEDGKPVVGGVFKFYSTYGYPLELIWLHLKEKGIEISWYHYIIDGLNENANINTLLASIEEFQEVPKSFREFFLTEFKI